MKKHFFILLLVIFSVYSFGIQTAIAELKHPYIVDEKSQVLFGDSIATSTYLGLENYNYNYVGGYLHISFTYTHHVCCYPSFPPFVYVTGLDPQTTPTPLERGGTAELYNLYGAPTDMYTIDVQFDSTGYNLLVKQAGQIETTNKHVDVTNGSESDWVGIVNQYPITPGFPPTPHSLAFTPRPIRESSSAPVVMFFPGIMGSRLYENQNGTEKEEWASVLDSNQARLGLDSNGKSINQIYTKDDTRSISGEAETGITDEIYGANIYNSFINDLRNWKKEGVISDYAFIPYDWRLSVEDIITKGATTTDGHLTYDNTQDFSESYILKKLTELSEKSSKIVLIGHSNGGLVIKALVQRLKDTNNPLYYKIDKIIFVAVPQVGTPEALVDLLHGTSLADGLLMRNERSRQLAENMPGVYNLLPSEAYFSVIDPGFAVDKVASFENDPAFSSQISQYGLFVSNIVELRNYLLGTDGRAKPAYSDTDSPSIGNSTLYEQARNMHTNLDLWQPAPNTKVIQVAGWGEETLAGISYKKCYDHSIDGYHKCFSPNVVVDGDGTVVTPSALWMSTSTPNVERWWVDLATYNTFFSPNLSRIHRDILEIPNIDELIKNKILNLQFNDQSKIVVNNTSTLKTTGDHLHYILHSPLTLGVVDSQGRYTGLDSITKLVRKEIPGVKYEVFGDTQFLSIPEGLSGKLKLSGYADGVFTLDEEKQEGNNILEHTSFDGIETSSTTVVTLDIIPNKSLASTTLNIDQNNDGIVDKVANTLGEIILVDTTPPEISIAYSTSTNDILFTGVDLNPTNVAVSTSSVTALDSQNNKTTLYYTKSRSGSEVKIVLKKIVRNGIETILPNIETEYEISKNKSGVVTQFESSVEIKDSEIFNLKYSLDKKTTTIREKVGGAYVTTIRNGLVIEKIVTDKSGVKFVY